MTWTAAEAGEVDLPAILAVYNDAIANTTAVYTDLPVLVARGEGRAFGGFASYGPFRPWPGYAATVEHSVYVAPEARRQGIGRLLVTALLAHARTHGVHVVIGGVDAANEASLALHRELGFTPAAHLHQVARKFGAWVDLILVEKCLS
jgi:L-amino acid N-acyltransferase YncA